MTTTPVLIPVEEYLSTAYHPDCDYIDGEVLERNLGEKPHARLQTFFSRFVAQFEDILRFETLTEQRVQVAPKVYRIPDVALVPISDTDERIVRTPPLLCIEILSSGDRLSNIRERIRDYATMGVRTCWVIDPWRRIAYTVGSDAILHEISGVLTVENTPISITVDEIFAELDRLERRAAEQA